MPLVHEAFDLFTTMPPLSPSCRRERHGVMRRCAVFLIGFSLATGGLLAGGIEYPAGGNFDPEEGTLELWLTPMAKDLAPPDDGQYHGILSFFSLDVPGEWRMSSPWYRHGGQLGPKVSLHSDKVKDGLTAILSSFAPEWKQGEMHHYAFVWKGRHMAHYADGKLLGEHEQATGFSGNPGAAVLGVGATGKNANGDDPLILHAVRISSVAKDASALANAKPEPELSTLLLDRFDSPTKTASGGTTPDVMFALDQSAKGKIVGHTHFVSSPAPGLALYSEGADQK